MQTARNLVTAAAELTACVENSEYNRNGRKSCFAVNADGNTTSVIGYFDYVAVLDYDVDFGAVACKSLVD